MRRDVIVCLVLVAATVAVYLPVLRNDFVYYDDDGYVFENPPVQGGLSWEGVRWAFTTMAEANWHPLTWLSHMTDCQLFGLKAGYHHATSLLWHAANAVLLYVALRRMTGAVWRSAAVAALFALHPLHVESVAWVAERKDVLSTFFWMLTLLAYGWYVRRPSWQRYGAVGGLLALGLMAKPMLVTLPFVLLVLDWWPLGRYAGASGLRPPKRASAAQAGGRVPSGQAPPGQAWWRRLGMLTAEKVPLLALAAASSVVTVIAQSRGGAVAPQEALPIGFRVANALVAYVAYLGKTFWPTGLAVFYPHPVRMPVWEIIGAAVVLAAITLGVVRFRRRRYGLAGWMWYVGTLVPVIGLVQVGSQAMADRYTYVPLVGVFVALVWGVADGAEWALARLGRPAWKRGVLTATAGAALAVCGATTVLQVLHWRDTETLFRHTLQVTRDTDLAHNNIGVALAGLGRWDEAVAEYREALRLNPQYAEAHNNLGAALAGLGRWDEAVAECREALRIKPQYAEARSNLGNALAGLGRWDEAVARYEETIRLAPDAPQPYNSLAWIRATHPEKQFRNGPEAVALAERAVSLGGGKDAACLATLAAAYAEAGRFADAVRRTAEQAVALAASQGQQALVDEIRTRLELYRADKPYHERGEDDKN